MSSKKLLRAVKRRNSDDTPSGIGCTFVKISSKWGLKIFNRPSPCKAAYRRQRHASKFKLAPPVGKLYKIDSDLYCYTTRIAKTVRCSDSRWHNLRFDKVYEISQFYDTFLGVLRNEFREKADNFGINICDEHWGNWGFYKGKLVFIDWGLN